LDNGFFIRPVARASEIEDVAGSERRELACRVSGLPAHLPRWQHQPARRCCSRTRSIKVQNDAVTKVTDKTGLDDFPED
jgi:hypothetical protein